MPDLSIAAAQPLSLLGAITAGQGVQANQIANATNQTNLNTLDALNKSRINFLNQQATGQDINNQGQQSLLPYLAPQAIENIGQTKAQTGLLNQQAQFFPLTAKAGWLGSLARLASGQAASDKAALAFYQSPQGQNVLATNPQDAQNFSNIMKRQGVQAAGGILNSSFGVAPPAGSASNNYSLLPSGGQSLPGGILNRSFGVAPPAGSASNNYSLLPSGGQSLPGRNPMQSQNLANNLNQLPNGSPAGLTIGSAGVTQPQNNTQTIQDASQAAYQKTANVNPGLTQKYSYAKNMLTTLTQYGNPAVTFAKYMGPSGWARYVKDSVANRNDPGYINFTSFKNNLSKLGTDQLTQFLKSSVQPEATAALGSIIEPLTFTQGATGAAKAWDDTINALRSEGSTAAKNVNKLNEFNQSFPAQQPKDILKNMDQLKKAGEIPADYFNTFSEPLQKAILEAHKGMKNG